MVTLRLAFLLLPLLSAQAPEFEVATLRVSPPPTGDSFNINLGLIRNGKLTISNANLGDCIKLAYNLVSDDQLTGPDWMRDKLVRFDVVAQAPPDTSREQVLLMLQSLLADRLKLKLHTEKRELSYSALLIGKNGSKLLPAGAVPGNGIHHSGNLDNTMTMEFLARLLSRFERDTVIDRTGLKGSFEVKLQWATAGNRAAVAGPNEVPDSPSGPSLSTALQEQLGIRLVRQKGPLDVLIVDSVQRVPADN